MDFSVPELSSVILGVLALASGILWLAHIPETMGKSMPETIADVQRLKNETASLAEVCCRGGAKDVEDIQYSMLNQHDDDSKELFGKENFDNVNFDYDDFNSSDEELTSELSAIAGDDLAKGRE